MIAPARVLALVLAIAAAGCSGGGDGPSGPSGPLPQQPGTPHPGTPDPGTPDPAPGVQGSYRLVQINQAQPGQLVTIANPGGAVIGLYRFQATTLTLGAVQAFALTLRYSDDKSAFELEDAGDFAQAGPVTDGALPLTFRSAVYGDAFTGVVLGDVVAIRYDFDGDGEGETSFAFQREG